MNIGFSCTVWAGGERAGHLDGIGIYTRALWQGLSDVTQGSDTRLKPYAFGKHLPAMACGSPQVLAKDYRIHAVLSGVLKLPLSNSAAIAVTSTCFMPQITTSRCFVACRRWPRSWT